MLFIHEEEHRLCRVVDNHSGLVLPTGSVQELLLVVSMMKFKLGLAGEGTSQLITVQTRTSGDGIGDARQFIGH